MSIGQSLGCYPDVIQAASAFPDLDVTVEEMPIKIPLAPIRVTF
jgi:hypothetical protein